MALRCAKSSVGTLLRQNLAWFYLKVFLDALIGYHYSKWPMRSGDISAFWGLTLKQLGNFFFQNVLLFSNFVSYKCGIYVWNWFGTTNIYSALLILMAWCFSTRASVVVTVLITQPCNFQLFTGWKKQQKTNKQPCPFLTLCNKKDIA